jgi:hypothetical protein
LMLLYPIVVAYSFWRPSTKANEDLMPDGYRRLGLRGKGRPPTTIGVKPRDHKFSDAAKEEKPCWVERLFVYPIKSCYPLELESASVLPMGMKHDRMFSFAQLLSSVPQQDHIGHYVTIHKWQMVTQRLCPFLTKVRTEIWVPDLNSAKNDPDGEWAKCGGFISVTFPFTPSIDCSVQGICNLWKVIKSLPTQPSLSFRVPLDPPQEYIDEKGYSLEEMTIWKDSPKALNMGCEIPPTVLASLKYAMGISNPLTLFRVHSEHPREVFRNAPRKEDLGYQPITGFQDAVGNVSALSHQLELMTSRCSQTPVSSPHPQLTKCLRSSIQDA